LFNSRIAVGYHIPVNLVDDSVHDSLENIPREVEGLGCHVISGGDGAEYDDLQQNSLIFSYQKSEEKSHT